MKLAFVTGRFVSFDNNTYYTDAGSGRLWEALLKQMQETYGSASQLFVSASLAPKRLGSHDHAVNSAYIKQKSIVMQPLPYIAGIAQGMWQDTSCRRIIASLEQQTDVMLVQLPFAPPTALYPPKKPRVYHVCADVVEVVGASAYYTGIKKVMAHSLARFIESWQRSLCRAPRTRVLTNGRALLAKNAYQNNGTAVVSSALRLEEILSVPRQRPAWNMKQPKARARILFVGYLRPEKGLDVLVSAYQKLRAAGLDAELRIVGALDAAEGGAEQDLRVALDEMTQAGLVSFAGQIPFGTRLLQEFADADVLVLPSRSEGTPRVLIEARAMGCPVVASNVGGIPTSITDQHDGLLVPAGDPLALTDAVYRVLHEPMLRQKLIENGLIRAKASTVESFAACMLQNVGQLAGL